MTEWVDEIATLSNQKLVKLLVMTDLDRYFHPHLVSYNGIKINCESFNIHFQERSENVVDMIRI